MNYLIWGGVWLGQFCIYESLAVWWKGCPWDTFSTTIWGLQVRYGAPVTLGVLFVLSVLLAHLPRYKNIEEGDKPREKSG